MAKKSGKSNKKIKKEGRILINEIKSQVSSGIEKAEDLCRWAEESKNDWNFRSASGLRTAAAKNYRLAAELISKLLNEVEKNREVDFTGLDNEIKKLKLKKDNYLRLAKENDKKAKISKENDLLYKETENNNPFKKIAVRKTSKKIIIPLVVITIISLTPNLTGFGILSDYQTGINLMGIIFFLLTLIAGFFLFQRYRIIKRVK